MCYYPEHWPREKWKLDAAQMAELGLQVVRIGEFAWSRLEPQAGELRFDWLDEAINTLTEVGLKVILGTPTAAPPKWLVDRWPEILAVDPATGRTRGFGSRRHYDFSSEIYLNESLRITDVLARRYGRHAGVLGWQTDSELCGHDTTLRASDSARRGFQIWCRGEYPSIGTLNKSWGNVFWSMEYQDFDEIELPVGAVTETNPAHQLAWRRFSSEKVIQYHSRMVAAIRRHARDQFVTHNFIPLVDTGVDNFALAEPLDFASYDSSPLGRTQRYFADADVATYRQYMRTGHPDLTTYYLDQSRGLSKVGFWVMQQQTGPINWADNNPRPAPGMVRLWTLEAFAHGAECVCYFPWRQARFAQEQMHSGLLRPDDSRTTAWGEAERAIAEVASIGVLDQPVAPARVAIVTAAEACWVSEIERQGDAYDCNDVQLSYYRALRELGVAVDFVSTDAELSSYALVLVPSAPILDDAFVTRCEQTEATIIFGPRAGAKTRQFSLPENLPPGVLQKILPLRVLSVETIRRDCEEPLEWDGRLYRSGIWREEIDPGDLQVIGRYGDDSAALVQNGRYIYCATLTCRAFLRDFFKAQCAALNIATYDFGPHVRVQSRGDLMFAFNYSADAVELALPDNPQFVLGARNIGGHDVAVWKRKVIVA